MSASIFLSSRRDLQVTDSTILSVRHFNYLLNSPPPQVASFFFPPFAKCFFKLLARSRILKAFKQTLCYHPFSSAAGRPIMSPPQPFVFGSPVPAVLSAAAAPFFPASLVPSTSSPFAAAMSPGSVGNVSFGVAVAVHAGADLSLRRAHQRLGSALQSSHGCLTESVRAWAKAASLVIQGRTAEAAALEKAGRRWEAASKRAEREVAAATAEVESGEQLVATLLASLQAMEQAALFFAASSSVVLPPAAPSSVLVSAPSPLNIVFILLSP